jgi:hypothetical protein
LAAHGRAALAWTRTRLGHDRAGAGLALCTVGLGLSFPEYLTTPELRQKYDVALLRQLLFAALVVSGGLSLTNLIVGRSR